MLAEFGERTNHFAVKCGDIIGRTAGDEVTVTYNIVINPACTCILQLRFEGRSGGHGASAHRSRLEQHSAAITDGGYQLAGLHEMSNELYFPNVQRWIRASARQQQSVEVLGMCGVQGNVGRSRQGGDTRVRGAHDALVSDEIFEEVQARLKGHAPHDIERDTFPLRGFVRCARCGKNLTAGWVTGRNQKYPRYWCWTKGCRAVTVRAERLEGSFRTLLGIIQPEAHLLASLPTIAARSWEQRKERIAADARQLTRRLQDQTTLNEKAIKAKLLGELTEMTSR